tara:strand:+ start:224 stop:1798 length:1575 start_codon:yes stop_codon:yes gene_type:complete
MNELGKLEALASNLIKEGKLNEAENIYLELINKGSRKHIVYSNLAGLAGLDKRYKDVIKYASISLEICGDQPNVLCNLGAAHKNLGNIECAIDIYLKALSLDPNSAEILCNLGNILQENGNYSDSIIALNKSIEIEPNSFESRYNLGISLFKNEDSDKAIEEYKYSIRIKPYHFYAYINLGNAFFAIGKYQKAKKSYEYALKIKPSSPEAKFNIAQILLLLGDYEIGLQYYEERFRALQGERLILTKTSLEQWDGKNLLKNQKLIVIAEQGFGDTIQFVRYLPYLSKLGIDITLIAQKELYKLLKFSNLNIEITTNNDLHNIESGRWIPLLSIPKLLGVEPTKPICSSKYLSTADEIKKKWKPIINQQKQPIIGINWQGNPKHENSNSRGRSILLEQLGPIANTISGSLLSFQKGYGSEQLLKCSFRDKFVTCQEQIDLSLDFSESAALIELCDLIITTDTSLAHLSGALGKRTWLLLKYVPEWRWGLNKNETFWYPSIRLFRQRIIGDWEEVVQRICSEIINI